MAQIESGHVDDRVGAVPVPDSVNRHVTGPGTEPGSVPGLVRLKWAMCKWGYRNCSCVVQTAVVLNILQLYHTNCSCVEQTAAVLNKLQLC